MYIIYKKYHALNEVILFGFLYFWGFLWPWKLIFIEHWWTLFLQFCFLGDLLKLHFFIRCLYFHKWWRERGTKINSSTIFEGCYLNLREKNWTFINTVDSRQFEYWKNWTPYKPLLKIFQKSNYLTGPLNKLVFYPNNCIVPLQILSYWESIVANPISSLARYI